NLSERAKFTPQDIKRPSGLWPAAGTLPGDDSDGAKSSLIQSSGAQLGVSHWRGGHLQTGYP
ncbi:hypothetical protein ABTM32_21820, partial [Acinetobacter baumannii]